jgi:hypothetical protein
VAVLFIRDNLASCRSSSSVRLGAIIAIYIAELELCIDLVRRVIDILTLYSLIA